MASSVFVAKPDSRVLINLAMSASHASIWRWIFALSTSRCPDAAASLSPPSVSLLVLLYPSLPRGVTFSKKSGDNVADGAGDGNVNVDGQGVGGLVKGVEDGGDMEDANNFRLLRLLLDDVAS